MTMTATPITPARMREIAALCEAATPGPWAATDCPGEIIDEPIGKYVVFRIGRAPIDGNTRFIAESRAAIPDLLAEVERLQSDLDRARAYSPFDAAPCPLCEYADGRHTRPCAMHAEIEGLQAKISRQGTRITALETGMRETCDIIGNMATHDEEQLQRLRELANGVA